MAPFDPELGAKYHAPVAQALEWQNAYTVQQSRWFPTEYDQLVARIAQLEMKPRAHLPDSPPKRWAGQQAAC